MWRESKAAKEDEAEPIPPLEETGRLKKVSTIVGIGGGGQTEANETQVLPRIVLYDDWQLTSVYATLTDEMLGAIRQIVREELARSGDRPSGEGATAS